MVILMENFIESFKFLIEIIRKKRSFCKRCAGLDVSGLSENDIE